MNANNINPLLTTRMFNVILALLGGVIFWQAMDFLSVITAPADPKNATGFANGLHRVFEVMGGSSFSTLVKLTSYILFIYAILDLRDKKQVVQKEKNGFLEGILPEKEQITLSISEVNQIKHAVMNRENNGVVYWLNSLIKKTATQFLNDNNMGDTMRMLDAQVETGKNEQEGQLEIVRFIIQTIPMLGFIGTIIELTSSLTLLGESDYMTKVRTAMSSAFDATLVALALTIFLTFRYHRHLESLDVFFAKSKAYILDNMISRIQR